MHLGACLSAALYLRRGSEIQTQHSLYFLTLGRQKIPLKMLSVSPHCGPVHPHIDFPHRCYLEDNHTLWKAINARRLLCPVLIGWYMCQSSVCAGPQGLIATIAHNHSKDQSAIAFLKVPNYLFSQQTGPVLQSSRWDQVSFLKRGM